MKAAAIRRYKQPVAIVDLPKPSPGPGDLLVKMRAASVNPIDFKIRDGGVKALVRYSFPLILGNDLAGEVQAVGEASRASAPATPSMRAWTSIASVPSPSMRWSARAPPPPSPRTSSGP